VLRRRRAGPEDARRVLAGDDRSGDVDREVAGQLLVAERFDGGRHPAPRYVRPVRVAREHVHDAQLEQALGGVLRGSVEASRNRARGDLEQGAELDELLDSGGTVLHFGISLGMREHRGDPGVDERAHGGAEGHRPAAVRELEEEVPAGLRNRQPGQLLARNLPEEAEVDLGSVQHLHRDALLSEVQT
jgi:hypothetical protein